MQVKRDLGKICPCASSEAHGERYGTDRRFPTMVLVLIFHIIWHDLLFVFKKNY